MTARTRRSKNRSAKSGQGRLGDEGAERDMWVFPEGHHIVLTIPGPRDLELDVDDARTIGEILIQTAAEMTEHRNDQAEGQDNDGGSEEHPAEG
ncbi:MAG: hypothetical protein ACRDQH_10155 [Pseudonocardiaceae bacterium]